MAELTSTAFVQQAVESEVALGQCMLSGDVPFSGMGLDIFNRRVQGVSWKDIADEFDLGTPSKARNVFTKLTGITDYKIKGPDLVKLAQGGLHESLTLSKKVKALQSAEAKADKALSITAKKVSNLKAQAFDDVYDALHKVDLDPSDYVEHLKYKGLSQKQIDFITDGFGPNDGIGMTDLYDIYDKLDIPIPKPVADYMKGLKVKGKVLDDLDVTQKWDDDVLSHSQADQVYNLHKQGNGYQAIVQKTGLDMESIDEIVWNSLLKDAKGDVWQAYIKKPGSQKGFNAVKQMTADLRKAGKTIEEITKKTGMDEKVVKAIVDGKWKLPSPGTNTYYTPPSYTPGGAGSASPKVPKGLASDDYPRLSDAHMQRELSPPLTEAQRSAMRSYTGSGYHDINGHLRGQHAGGARTLDKIQKMDSAMTTSTTPMTVSRGMGRDGFSMGYLSDTEMAKLPGVVVRDRAFMSTSIGDVFSNQVRFIIECPPGTKGYYAKPISGFKNELEFIMARDTNIMITSAEKIGSQWIVRGRVIV